MSKYTMSIKSICDMVDSDGKLKSFDEHVKNSRSKIFNFDYPIFDENYRSILETKILKHFYMDEICEETYGLWHVRLNTKINEILPYYNQLYESTLLKYNPLWNSDFTTEHEGKTDETNDNVSGFGSSTTVNVDENIDTTNNRESQTTDEKHMSTHGENELNEEFSNSYTKDIDSESNTNSTETVESDTQNTSDGSSQETSNTTFGKTNSTTVDIENDKTVESPGTKTVIRESDTPQGSISRIEDNTYLSKATIQDNSGNNTTTHTGTTTTTSNDGGTEVNSNNKSHTENYSSSATSNSSSETTTVNNTDESGSDSGNKNTTSVDNALTNENGNSDTTESENGNVKTTSKSETTTNNTSNSNTKINNINSYTTHVFGNNGKSFPSLIKEFRESFLNIDMMVIDELEELFFGLWN